MSFRVSRVLPDEGIPRPVVRLLRPPRWRAPLEPDHAHLDHSGRSCPPYAPVGPVGPGDQAGLRGEDREV